MTCLPLTTRLSVRLRLIEGLIHRSSINAGYGTCGLSTGNWGRFREVNYDKMRWKEVGVMIRWQFIEQKDKLLIRTFSGGPLESAEGGQGACDKCGNSLEEDVDGGVDLVSRVVCGKCGSLRRLEALREPPTYFEILGQNRAYRVDVQGLAQRARQLQKRFHPDLYSQKGDDQQHLSQEYSSLINKALTTLADPISRGRYMLMLSGLEANEEEDQVLDLERSMTNDPEFLEEVMELNERLEEISTERDWMEFRNENEETMKMIQIELEKAFEAKDTTEAQRLLGRLKFFDTLQYKLKELQSKIGIVE